VGTFATRTRASPQRRRPDIDQRCYSNDLDRDIASTIAADLKILDNDDLIEPTETPERGLTHPSHKRIK
jgi:hypothetical protein